MLAAMLVGALVTAAFGDGPPDPGVIIEWITEGNDDPTAVPSTQAAATVVPATDQPSPTHSGGPTGFAYPIAGACLPENDSLMPGAPRTYRQATHEGIDIYDSDNCAFVGLDTEVLAAKAGTIVRADHIYQELTPESLAILEERVALEGGDVPEVEDAFRGRQVWIDHGDGTLTRYAHLADIAEDALVGTEVEQGDLVGYVGESGTPESVTDPGAQVHLHFELRIGGSYLGAGVDPAASRQRYIEAFSQ